MNSLLLKSACVLGLAACIGAVAQQPPQATDLSGSPFFIKQSWIIGGAGNWDYLTLDTAASQLYIAHGREVQVVNVETGALAGRVSGLHEAHDIALDESGEFGYVSDGPANEVKVFDRRSFQVVASIPTGPTPRALAIDAETGLLFAICTNPLTEAEPQTPARQPQRPIGSNPHPPARPRPAQPQTDREIKTSITVIDLAARKRVGEILMPGKLGFAQADGKGQLFVLVVDRNQVARIDAQGVATLLQKRMDAAPGDNGTGGPAGTADTRAPGSNSANPDTDSHTPATGSPTSDAAPPTANPAKDDATPAMLDWSHESRQPDSAQESLRIFTLGPGCQDPRSLAVDGTHQRLFAACNNMQLDVLNAESGAIVTQLPIGPGADAVGYDASRGLIYTANGGAQGTLTIIHQDVTDTYSEIQNLATRQRARTLAVNPETGQVYLVTDYVGVNLAKQGGIGTLKTVPVDGSFQVLVIGH